MLVLLSDCVFPVPFPAVLATAVFFQFPFSGVIGNAVFFQFPFPGTIENAVFFQFPFSGVIENAVFFQFLFFSVYEVLCFSRSLSLSQFPSSSLPSSLRGFPMFFQGKCVADFFKEKTKMFSFLKTGKTRHFQWRPGQELEKHRFSTTS